MKGAAVWRDIQLWKRLLESARVLGNPQSIGRGHFGLGITYYLQGSIAWALDEFRSAAEIGRHSGDVLGESSAHLAMGDVLLAAHRMDEAAESLRDGVSVVPQGRT